MPSVEQELADRLALGEEIVVATVVKVDGQPPSQPGAKLLMTRSVSIAGTLADANAIAAGGSPQVHTYRHDLGSIDVYLEPYAGAPMLVVFAATPIARELVRWAPEVGFRTLLVESVKELPALLPSDVYVVHTNHDAEDLVQALEAVLPRNPRFIGLVGSRRHTGHHLETLRAKGVQEDVIARIQSPVGLDIGARTPAEIALSILAGLVAIRRGGQGGWKQTPSA
jgi:xanthine dehydrogenase accessory factor